VYHFPYITSCLPTNVGMALVKRNRQRHMTVRQAKERLQTLVVHFDSFVIINEIRFDCVDNISEAADDIIIFACPCNNNSSRLENQEHNWRIIRPENQSWEY